MGDPRRPVRQGKPTSVTCRHCRGPRLLLRGVYFCEKCDAPEQDGIIFRPTWKPRFL